MSLVFNTIIDFIFKAVFFIKAKENVSLYSIATAKYSFSEVTFSRF